MTEILESPFCHFRLELPSGEWSLYPRARRSPYLEGVRMAAAYWSARRGVLWQGGLSGAQVEGCQTRSSPRVPWRC